MYAQGQTKSLCLDPTMDSINAIAAVSHYCEDASLCGIHSNNICNNNNNVFIIFPSSEYRQICTVFLLE